MRITTERLVLREYEVDDAPSRFAYFNDPGVMRFQTLAPMPTLEDACAQVADNYTRAQNEPRLEYVFAITLSGNVIGESGLLLDGENNRSAFIF